MKKQTYTIHVTCSVNKYNKIQRYIRNLIPTGTKFDRLIHQYGETFEKLMAKGATAQDIYKHITINRNDDQEPITMQETYRIINKLGYKLAYTKQK